jgi:hypothetical protein
MQIPNSIMKMKLIPTTKLALLCTAVCATMFAFSPNAKALTIGDPQTLGYVFFGIPSGDADRLSYVNHLIDMVPGTSDTFSGQNFTRTLNNPGPGFPNYPNAVLSGLVNGSSTSINLGATAGVYQYLFAKYDGPNQGSVVWYVGNLSGVITIPAKWGKYGLSGWTLFKGENGGNGVPDGGTTVMLLGAALASLGMARRYLKR